MSSNLDSEMKTYTTLFKQHDMALYKLNQLFKTISINGLKFIEKSKKSLDDFFIEFKNENSSATHIICLTNFYNGLKNYFEKLKIIFQNIDTQCAEKVVEFSTNFKNKNTESINSMVKVNNALKEQTAILEKVKFDYFNASKINDQDFLRTQKGTKKEEETKKNKDIYEKSKKILDEMKEKYFLNINTFNKNLVILEKHYTNEVSKIHSEQEKKIKFYYDILNVFKLQINGVSDANKDILNVIDKINKSQNIERDVELFKDDYNFLDENKKRFFFEIFLDYEVFRNNNLEKKNNKDNKDKKTWNFNIKDESDERINDLVKKIFNGNDKINDDDITFLMNFVEKNKENKDKFIEILIYNYNFSNKFLKINSIYNFNALANLIQLIFDSYSNDIDSNLDKFYFMIKISENTINCDHEFISIKNYLCQKISSLNLLKQKKFWIKLIENKIKEVTEEKTKADIEKKEKGNNIRGGSYNEKSNTGYSKYFNFFSSGNKKVENEIVFGQKFKDNLPLCCLEVLEKYIKHFTNFNLSKEKAIEIIKEIHKKYKFQKGYLEYFISEINSNIYSYNKIFINDIFEVMKLKVDYNKFNFIDNDLNQIKNSPKLFALISSLKYLESNDYFNIILLNKEYYNSIKKIIYKIFLLKNSDSEITLDKKLYIWKKILDYSENKEKYNYEKIKEIIISKSPTKKGRDVIDLDVVRTWFENDKELNQKKLSILLKSLVHALPELNYNQGMNYVGAFLLNITNNEEDAFYLFLGLLTSTKYGDLFKNDLAKLKRFFYIFERMINIFIPELYNFLLSNNIKVNYFISSWFITLFTNAYQFIKDKDNPKIVLKIFDLFFCNNWKSIIITSISLLKVYEPKIMLFNSEEIMRFLINDIIKENYFENNNYDKFMYISYNFKIDDKLIENLEKELDIQKKLPNIEKNLGSQII